MPGDIDPAIGQECDAFILQHQPLQALFPSSERIATAEGAVLVDYPVAGQTASLRRVGHDTADDTGSSRTTCQQGDQSVGRHTPRRNLANKVAYFGIESFIHMGIIPQIYRKKQTEHTPWRPDGRPSSSARPASAPHHPSEDFSGRPTCAGSSFP